MSLQHQYDLSTLPTASPHKLSEEGLDAIHETSIHILEDIGIQVGHDEMREILDEAGAVVEDDDMVSFPRSMVEDAVESAPSSFEMHGRNPDRDVTVGEGDPVIAPGYGAPNVLTYEDGRRQSTLSDYEDLVKLAQVEDEISCSGYVLCEPNDIPQEVKHLEMVKRTLKYTDMPLMGSPYGEDRAKASIDMVSMAVEDPEMSRPYMTATCNPVPPRQWDERMTGGLLQYARHNQPVLVGNLLMANASGPSSLAGSLALTNAEILAGITMTQVVNPGVPVIHGTITSNVDVRSGALSMGSPEGTLCTSFASQIGNYYDVPARAGGGLTDAKTVDDQSGAESMMQLMMAMLGDIDFMLHGAGILDSFGTVSPEKFVLDCERIRYLNEIEAGYDITEETFATDLIEEVEPGGHFLNKRHTLEHSKEHHYFSNIYAKDSYDNWENAGAKDAFESAADTVDERLDAYERPPMDDDVQADIEDYVDEQREEILG
jgi:trimethylamine--corrinoid protein Co-methyltransferase